MAAVPVTGFTATRRTKECTVLFSATFSSTMMRLPSRLQRITAFKKAVPGALGSMA